MKRQRVGQMGQSMVTLIRPPQIPLYILIGADPGGGGPGGQDPPFWGTPKLRKKGKNVARVRAKTLRFST